MITEFDLDLGDGRTLHAYDAGGAGDLAVFWHHGTPNVGAPPRPLFEAAERLGIRWLSYDRPGYGGSTRRPGRNVASSAACAAAVADALGIATFAVMGHSGGGPHALACAALLPERVLGAVIVSGLAPYDAPGLDWFDGMYASGIASLHAALQGLEARERFEAAGARHHPGFTLADLAALAGPWRWLGEVMRQATGHGPGGLIDDEISYVTSWGFDPAQADAPVLLVHGRLDRIIPAMHAEWLARRLPLSELRLTDEDGHISVLNSAVLALQWLRTVARRPFWLAGS
jgi:pimeloyl-ACP methyl ester carboxylesterase